MRNILVLSAFTALIAAGGALRAADWVSAPSYFTHDPNTGKRVTQFAPVPPVYASNYQKSVYHHTRSTLQVGNSIDIYHQIDEYGREVRPYDEWRFPYRPYSVPYSQWGPPFGGLGGGFGYGYGGGYGGDANQRYPNFPGIEGFGQYQPWFNGYYPDARSNVPFPNPNIFPPVPGGGTDVNIGAGNAGDIDVNGGINVPGNGNRINRSNN
ncbi:MAG: hypothetical protein RIC55_08945 [Pirellulaceae bacterium]